MILLLQTQVATAPGCDVLDLVIDYFYMNANISRKTFYKTTFSSTCESRYCSLVPQSSCGLAVLYSAADQSSRLMDLEWICFCVKEMSKSQTRLVNVVLDYDISMKVLEARREQKL